MNHYLPSAFNYKEFNSKIVTRTEDLQKGSLRWKDYIQNVLSKLCNLCSRHSHVSSFCPHSLAPGPNYYLTLGAITRPLTMSLLWPASFSNSGFEGKDKRRASFTNLCLYKPSDFTSPETVPLVFQMGDNTELWGFVFQGKPAKSKAKRETR